MQRLIFVWSDFTLLFIFLYSIITSYSIFFVLYVSDKYMNSFHFSCFPTNNHSAVQWLTRNRKFFEPSLDAIKYKPVNSLYGLFSLTFGESSIMYTAYIAAITDELSWDNVFFQIENQYLYFVGFIFWSSKMMINICCHGLSSSVRVFDKLYLFLIALENTHKIFYFFSLTIILQQFLKLNLNFYWLSQQNTTFHVYTNNIDRTLFFTISPIILEKFKKI